MPLFKGKKKYHYDTRKDISGIEDNLNWMMEHIGRIEHYMSVFGSDIDDYLSNTQYQDCCDSNINQIIACADRILSKDKAFFERYFGWFGEPVAIRVSTIHFYPSAYRNDVWEFMTEMLPQIKESCEAALNDIRAGKDGSQASNNRRGRFHMW